MDETISTRMLKGAFRLFLCDLEALPEDAYDRRFGGKARTVADLVYEVNRVNDHVGMVIRGEVPFEWIDGWLTAPEGFGGKAAVIEAFRTSSGRIVSTVERFSAEELEAKLQTDEGETTRAERCRFVALHTWYHSGQLNFVQTLLGDDAWHWI